MRCQFVAAGMRCLKKSLNRGKGRIAFNRIRWRAETGVEGLGASAPRAKSRQNDSDRAPLHRQLLFGSLRPGTAELEALGLSGQRIAIDAQKIGGRSQLALGPLQGLPENGTVHLV